MENRREEQQSYESQNEEKQGFQQHNKELVNPNKIKTKRGDFDLTPIFPYPPKFFDACLTSISNNLERGNHPFYALNGNTLSNLFLQGIASGNLNFIQHLVSFDFNEVINYNLFYFSQLNDLHGRILDLAVNQIIVDDCTSMDVVNDLLMKGAKSDNFKALKNNLLVKIAQSNDNSFQLKGFYQINLINILDGTYNEKYVIKNALDFNNSKNKTMEKSFNITRKTIESKSTLSEEDREKGKENDLLKNRMYDTSFSQKLMNRVCEQLSSEKNLYKNKKRLRKINGIEIPLSLQKFLYSNAAINMQMIPFLKQKLKQGEIHFDRYDLFKNEENDTFSLLMEKDCENNAKLNDWKEQEGVLLFLKDFKQDDIIKPKPLNEIYKNEEWSIESQKENNEVKEKETKISRLRQFFKSL